MKLTPMTSLFLAGGLCSIGFLAAKPDAEEPGKTEQLMDFEAEAEAPVWFSENDGVMGGLSVGEPTIKHGVLHFRGNISLQNDGGFSSIWTKAEYDFSKQEALVMLVKGDGRTYQFRLETDALHKGSAVSYGAEFKTETGKWIEVEVPFESLSPTWRGGKLDGPPLDLSKVGQIGIFLGDKKQGRFSLAVDWIAVK